MEVPLVVCPICAISLVEPYIKCAICTNPPISICLPCFAKGREYGTHENDHDYIIMGNNFSLFDPAWSAAEEEKLLSAISECGIGNWIDIAAALGTKTKTECANHYYHYYTKAPFPEALEEDSGTVSLLMPVPCISTKDPPRPVVGSAAYSEMSGYMPARGDFVSEYDDFLEMNLNGDEFLDDNDDDPHLLELKKVALRIFNENLRKRAQWKCILKTYGLISAKKNFEEWERYRPLGKSCTDNMKMLMRLMKPDSFDELMEGTLSEMKLKQRIKILQESRMAGITKLQSISTYMKLKQSRENAQLQFRNRKMLDDVLTHVKDDATREDFIRKQAMKETSQGLPSTIPLPSSSTGRRSAPPLPINGLPSFEKLNERERDLCSMLRIYPTAYMQYKTTLVNEYRKLGYLRLANARSVIKIDVNKTRKIYDLLVKEGIVTKESTCDTTVPCY